MTDAATLEIAKLRSEIVSMMALLSPWIGMEEMCARYDCTSKTILAMERRDAIPVRVNGRWSRQDVVEYERLQLSR